MGAVPLKTHVNDATPNGQNRSFVTFYDDWQWRNRDYSWITLRLFLGK
ncbi:MAG: hypothetical protein R2788_19590 [Saprospiraceae bacterium]